MFITFWLLRKNGKFSSSFRDLSVEKLAAVNVPFSPLLYEEMANFGTRVATPLVAAPLGLLLALNVIELS